MGIRNRQRASDQGVGYLAHNPSWGFGTGKRYGSFRMVLRLITPHGDSEPVTGRPVFACGRSHNPSWGFGTDSGFWQADPDEIS